MTTARVVKIDSKVRYQRTPSNLGGSKNVHIAFP
jgi:hypothetical protein